MSVIFGYEDMAPMRALACAAGDTNEISMIFGYEDMALFKKCPTFLKMFGWLGGCASVCRCHFSVKLSI